MLSTTHGWRDWRELNDMRSMACTSSTRQDGTVMLTADASFYNGGTFTDEQGRPTYACITYAETVAAPDDREHRVDDFESLCGRWEQKGQGLHGNDAV
jgi:hypothetical protein